MLSGKTLLLTLLISLFLINSNKIEANNESDYFIRESSQENKDQSSKNKLNLFPDNISNFDFIYHTIPIYQDFENLANIYPVIAFIESEVYRTEKKRIKLSERFVIYYYFIESTISFLNEGEFHYNRINSYHSIFEIINKYGIVPNGEYNSKTLCEESFRSLNKDYYSYLDFVIDSDIRNMDLIINKVKSILDFYLGEPPSHFAYNGTIFEPGNFLTDHLKIRTDDYFSFTSYIIYNYNEKSKITNTDRFYSYNLNLDDFTGLIQHALISGFPVLICPDKKYEGYDYLSGIVQVLPADMPTGEIDHYTRHFRLIKDDIIADNAFSYANVVGHKIKNGEIYYLISDQDKRAFENLPAGYLFYEENYVKLKVLYFVLHVDAARYILDKIIK